MSAVGVVIATAGTFVSKVMLSLAWLETLPEASLYQQ